MFNFNNNYNYYYLKIKVDYLCSENQCLNTQIKKLNYKIKNLKNIHCHNNNKIIEICETLNHNIDKIKKDINNKTNKTNDNDDDFIQIY